MVDRPRPEGPVVLALAFGDDEVVDAGEAHRHQTVLVELPVFVAVAAKPVTAVVVPLVGEAHGDAILTKRPDLLDQAIVELPLPLAQEEGLDRRTSLQKLGA